jgi:hypothetical protein
MILAQVQSVYSLSPNNPEPFLKVCQSFLHSKAASRRLSWNAGPLRAVDFGLLDPVVQRLGRTADLSRNQRHRRPAERMLAGVIQNHPDSPNPNPRQKRVHRLACQGSILSGIGASGKPWWRFSSGFAGFDGVLAAKFKGADIEGALHDLAQARDRQHRLRALRSSLILAVGCPVAARRAFKRVKRNNG